ncbi:MAG: UDP-N-acetylglucosamine 2-epimerase, partial [Devosia sp.]
GNRQNLRERNANIIDVPTDPASIAQGIAQALHRGRLPATNVYGDGTAAARIVAALRQLDLADPSLMAKVNVY